MKYYFNSYNYVNYWSGGISEGKGGPRAVSV